jgi:hypothetical protein
MKGAVIQPRDTFQFHPNLYSTSLDTVQRARHGAERGTRCAGPGGHAACLEHR